MKTRTACLLFLALLLTGCSSLASIPYTPALTPEGWLAEQPHAQVTLGALHFILMQPSSTVFVYLLGLLAVAAGVRFFRARGGQHSRAWWGLALALWGLGALAAGTSYQAFSYEIKCAGRAACAWTSWWEIAYLLLSAGSINAFVAATAFTGHQGAGRKCLILYAGANFTLFAACVLAGTQTLTPFLMSFELLLIASAPSILLLFGLSARRYARHKQRLDLAFLVTWLWLGLVIGVYYGYLVSGLEGRLWAQGLWFSANDVLHLGLISWMLFMSVNVYRYLVDRQPAPTPAPAITAVSEKEGGISL